MIVAAVQHRVAGELVSGLERVADGVAEAASMGARLVVFPETFLPGYPAWLDVCRDAGLWDHAPVKQAFRRMAEESLEVPGPASERLGALAREHDITLVIGVSERVSAGPGRGTLYNTLLTYGPSGSLLNHHRKLMPTYTERLVWGLGDGAGVRAVDTPAGRIGGLICWEHWMPLTRQALHESGEDIHVAVWPTVKDMNLIACRQYAFEGRCWVIACGAIMHASALPQGLDAHPERVDGPDAFLLRGGSAVIAPDGTVVKGPVFDSVTILTAEVSLERIREESMSLDVTGHYSRPDVFRLERIAQRREIP